MRNFQVPGTIDTLAEARAFYSDLHFVYWYARPTKFLAGPGGQSTWYLRQASETFARSGVGQNLTVIENYRADLGAIVFIDGRRTVLHP